MSESHVIVFVRQPEKGKVKSRIAKVAGEDDAYHIYKTLYDGTLNLARVIPYNYTIYSTASVNDHGIRLQEGVDLGERMYNSFKDVFNEGKGPVVIIGSDCPGLNPEIKREIVRNYRLAKKGGSHERRQGVRQ